ncbi:MAG: recombinase family protein, partial [Bdellovibrionota bacterium]
GGGSRVRLGYFTTSNLHDLLRNKLYAGVQHYVARGELCEAKAVWEPLVSRDLFDQVQGILKKNHHRYKPDSFKVHPYLLTGLTYCARCGASLCGKSATGRTGKVPYYEHGWLTKKNGTLLKAAYDCRPLRYPARLIEPAVWTEIEKVITDSEFAKDLVTEARRKFDSQTQGSEEDLFKNRIHGVQSQLDALAERLSQLPKGVPAEPIYRQMERLEGHRKAEEANLAAAREAQAEKGTEPAEWPDYIALIEALKAPRKAERGTGDPRAKIIRALVDRVEIQPEGGIKIYFNLARTKIERETKKTKGPGHEGSVPLISASEPLGSRSLTNGWRDRD